MDIIVLSTGELILFCNIKSLILMIYTFFGDEHLFCIILVVSFSISLISLHNFVSVSKKMLNKIVKT